MRKITQISRIYRCYTSTLLGQYVDISGQQPDLPAVYDATKYSASQTFGEQLRTDGRAGILYSSLRRANSINIAAFRPRNIEDVTQADHFEVTVTATDRRIDVRKINA